MSFVDWFVFPAPSSSYTAESFPGQLIWVPYNPKALSSFRRSQDLSLTDDSDASDLISGMSLLSGETKTSEMNSLKSPASRSVSLSVSDSTWPSMSISGNLDNTAESDGMDHFRNHLPCLLVQKCANPKYLVLYCHGNAVDLGMIHDTLEKMSESLKVTVLAFEYPGYGICKRSFGSSSVEKIQNAAVSVLKFAISHLDISPERIIFFGRSLGSGPATLLSFLTRANPCRALVLVSPYTSINDIARRIVGKWIAHSVMQRRFPNIDLMEHIRCPLLFIHGMKDEVIPCSHSAWLHEAASHLGDDWRRLHVVQDQTHNGLSLSIDILCPIESFLKDTEAEFNQRNSDDGLSIRVCEGFLRIPQQYKPTRKWKVVKKEDKY